MNLDNLRNTLIDKNLKITPQRIAVLEAIIKLNNHPTAEKIIESIKINHPNIAIGTVYNILETFVKKGIIKKVKTEKDVMRYDPLIQNHHHLYCFESDRIEDYFDEELNKLLEKYFKTKQIKNFNINEVKLQIIGRFKN